MHSGLATRLHTTGPGEGTVLAAANITGTDVVRSSSMIGSFISTAKSGNR
jgi:hypothetical protein